MDLEKSVYCIKRRKSNVLLFIILFCTLLLFYYFFCNISGLSKNISEIEKTYGGTFKIEMFRDETNP